jgi:hypothetical protein|tara:strand:- start:97 stop:342 length:246 start_codon:yes stop_codon:yes gene_type:complete
MITEEKTQVEFRIINTEEMPPIVITQSESDNPKVVLNIHHKIWISLHRKVIAGIIESLQDKLDSILTSYLAEQRAFEKMEE